MNNSAGQVRYDITANVDDFLAQLREAGKAIDDFGDRVSEQDKLLIMQWNNMASEMELAIQKAAIEASKPIVDFVDQTITQISSMNKAIVQSGISALQIVSGAATTAITSLVSKGVEGADSLSKFNAQIIGLAESTNDANSAMSAAYTFFKGNPFQRFETVEAVKNLMMYDKSIANAATNSAKLTKTLDMLGVASLSSGTPLAELASKWAEVSSQTRVSKGQFEELALRVPALYDAVGKRMGVSASEVSEKLNRVGVDTKIVKQAMEDLYGLDTKKLNNKDLKERQKYLDSLGKAARQSAEAYIAFNNTMARQDDRVKGRIADMAQAIAGYELTAEGGFKAVEGGIYQSVINLKRAFADALDSTSETAAKMRSAFGKLGGAIAPFIDKIAEKLPDILDKLFDLIDKLGDHIELLLPILAGALTLFGGLASNVPFLGPAIEKVTGPVKSLAGTFLKLNPALKILFALLGAGAFKAIKDGKLSGPLKSIFESLQKIGKALAPVAEQVARIFAEIGEKVVVSLLESLAKVLEVLANVISSLPTEVLTGFVLALISLSGVATIASPIAKTISSIKSLSQGIIDAFNVKSQALGGIEKIKNALNGTSGLAESASESAKNMSGASGSIKNMSKSATKMNTGMSKVDKVLGSIMKGAASVILIAVAIAAVAGALKLTYNLFKEVDLGKLLLDMGTLLLVVGVAGLVMAGIGALGKYSAIGSVVSVVISGGLLASAYLLSKISPYVRLINLEEILKLEGIIAVVGLILAAISGFAVFGAIGSIASAIIGGGLLVASAALAEASSHVSNINVDEIKKLSSIIAEVSAILTMISGFAVFGAIGAIANDIVAGGLLVASLALEETGKHVSGIDLESIIRLSEILAVVDVILGTLSGFAIFGAIGTVANDIISGGLLLSALALQETSKHSSPSEISLDNIRNLLSVITEVDVILGIISGFALLGAIGTIANDIISGGLLVAAIALVETSKQSKDIKIDDIRKLTSAITEINGIMAILSGFSVFAAIGTLVNDVISGGILLAAKALLETSKYASQLSEEDFNSIQNILTKLSTLGTGDIFSNLSNLVNSGVLSGITDNVYNIITKFSSLKPINDEVVNSLKKNVEELSKMKIEGSGLFENKGGAAQELEKIVGHVANIARLLNSVPWIDYDTIARLIDSIKLFDRIDDNARNGIRRLNDLGDSLGNIDWIKRIFGDVPEDIWDRALRLINSAKLFDRIDDNARNGALRLKDMGDSLGNIDWIKRILGDVPEDLPQRASNLVSAVKKFGELSFSQEEVANAIASVKSIVLQMKSIIDSLMPAMNTSGKNIGSQIILGAESQLSPLTDLGKRYIDAFTLGMNSKNSSLIEAGRNVQGTIWNAIEPKMKDEYYQGRTLAQNLINGFNSKHNGNDTFYNAGKNAVQGFIDGAKSKNVYFTGWQIADSYLNGLKARGREGSPWKTTYQSGIWAVEGMIDGIERMSYKLRMSAQSIADTVIDAMTIDNLGDSIGLTNLKNLSMSISGQGEEGTLGGVNSKSNTINIYNTNYAQTDFNQMSRDIMFNISRL